MKRTILLVCAIICICLVACRKGIPYSTWVVNGEGFSTNKVAETNDKAGSSLETDDKENGFAMGWGLHSLPGGGTHYISIQQSNNPALLRVSFYYKGAFYILSSNNGGSLIATVVNDRMHYEMSAAWFKNYNNPMDSVLIRATIIQP